MVLFFPQTVYCWGSQCCLKCVRLGWGAVSASLGLSPACLPSGLGCCVRLAGLVFLLSSVLSPSLSPIWSGMLCPPRWSCLPLVYGLVSPSLSPIWSGMLCPPRWSCLSLVFGLVSQLVSHLVWDAVSASLVVSFSCLRPCLPSGLGCCVRLAGRVFLLSSALSPIWSGWLVVSFSCLRSCVPACLPAGLGCGVCALGLSTKNHVRLVKLFGVYGGVILPSSNWCMTNEIGLGPWTWNSEDISFHPDYS